MRPHVRRANVFLLLPLVLGVGCGDSPTDPANTSAEGGAGGGSGGGGGMVMLGGSLAKGCGIFPADNPWNEDISQLPVDPNSDAYLSEMNQSGTRMLHPDFGSDFTYGIPFIIVPTTQAKVAVDFTYVSESDPGPYPIPLTAPIEGTTDPTGDRHVIAIDKDACKLYELYAARPMTSSWKADSGAVYDLKSNALRPDQWTSADAAGLPIFPGLVRMDEAVKTGVIKHALRFTMSRTQNAFVHPATHGASSITDPNTPPMGLRLRLKASFDTSKFAGPSKAVVTALKTYGMFLADNGSDWFLSGEASSAKAAWTDDDITPLKVVPASAFEVVKLAGPVVPQNP